MFGLSSSSVASSVLDKLREDHRKVKNLFEQFDGADNKTKRHIVKTAIQELTIHSDLEEKLVYPAIRAEIDDGSMMDEALEEHHVVHVLITELKRMSPGTERFDAKFTVLAENVKHHIGEEEGQMFPKAENLDIDWEELEAQMMKRKEQLLSSSRAKNNGRSASKRTARHRNGRSRKSRRPSRAARRT